MRSARFRLLSCFLLLNSSVWAQTTASPQQVPTTQAIRDPQALSVLNQALTAAGGVSAIAAITDYTATGTITYNNNSLEQGSMTLQGLGLIAFRLDANLPAGVRSLAISDGEITQKAEDGTISKPLTQAPMYPGSFVLPYLHLANALQIPPFRISYQGLVQIDGHSAHAVRVQRLLPPNFGIAFQTRDFFVDASTFQVLMTREMTDSRAGARQVHYSDYRPIGGVLVPFSIIEELGFQQTLTIHLEQISFDTGLQETAFRF